jgi:hypothetical protein
VMPTRFRTDLGMETWPFFPNFTISIFHSFQIPASRIMEL